MNPEDREYFDQQLDQVMAEMPARVHDLIRQVPLYVEDHPSAETMRQMGIRRRKELCGLYTGIPLIKRSVEDSGILSDAVCIYREGILHLATGPHGKIDERELREQIRITILHELGHHHGLDEDELQQLGYG